MSATLRVLDDNNYGEKNLTFSFPHSSCIVSDFAVFQTFPQPPDLVVAQFNLEFFVFLRIFPHRVCSEGGFQIHAHIEK